MTTQIKKGDVLTNARWWTTNNPRLTCKHYVVLRVMKKDGGTVAVRGLNKNGTQFRNGRLEIPLDEAMDEAKWYYHKKGSEAARMFCKKKV